jgi:hypothetical protein
LAWTSVGSLGAAAGPKTGLFTLDFSFARDVDAGAVVVLWLGWDSIFSVFTPREDHVHVKDSVGNWWARLGDKTSTGCFAQCGAIASIWICQLKYPLTTGATIQARVDYGGDPGLLENRLISAWEFALPEGYGWAVTGTDPTIFEERPGTGVALSWVPEESGEYLFLHALASEGPSTDSYTDPAGFTPIDSVGNTGGLDEENVTLHGGWKIDTAAGVTSDPALSPARDLSQVLVGVFPILKSTTFPRTPIIDDFNRADENPLDGGIWIPGFDEDGPNESFTTGPSSPGTRLLQLISNEAAAGDTSAGGQATVEDYVCDDMEVYATYSVFPDDFVGAVHLFIHHRGQTDDADASGWGVSLGNTGNGAMPPGWYLLRVGQQGNQGVPSNATLEFQIADGFAPTAGDVWKLGLQRFRKTMHLWVDSGAGWEWVGARRQLSGNDSGKLGLAIWDPESRVDDFGGGPTCFMVNMNWREANRAKSATRGLVNPSDQRYL